MSLSAGLVAGLAAALLLPVPAASAQEAQPSEYQFKAAFLYHFAQLVTWPEAAFAGAKSPLVVGVLGQNPFGSWLEQTIQQKSVNGRPLAVKKFQFESLNEAASSCHILFISTSEKDRLSAILTALEGKNILTVGEMDHFTDTESGGMIKLFRDGTKIRFQINDGAARSAGLKISSKLLSLASTKAQ